MDDVIQLRIMRSDADFPKDPVTGKYIYTVSTDGKKAYINVKK
jgi:hypothetical protein